MAASERVDLRFTLITAGVLLALLAGVWAWQRLARPEEVLFDEPLEMPPWPESEPPEGEQGAEEQAAAVRFTPQLEVDGPTTLQIELQREAVEGWVGVGVALVHEDSGEVRELGLSSTYRKDVDGEPHGQRVVDALVDQVQSGGWVVRLEPAWDPIDEPLPGRADASPEPQAPPSVRIRITEGRRSPWQLWLAAGLIMLPAVVQIGRRVWYTRRSKTGRE